jgi:O-antigen ligase
MLYSIEYDRRLIDISHTSKSCIVSLNKYVVATITLFLILIYLDLPAFIFEINHIILPKYFYFAMFTLTIPVILLRYRNFIRYLTSSCTLWAMAFALLNVTHWIIASYNNDSDVIALIATRIQYLGLAVLMGFLLSTVPGSCYDRVFPFLTVIITLLLIWGFVMPWSVSTGMEGAVLGRAGATFINPNKAGEGLLLTCVLGILILKGSLRAVLVMLVLVGIMSTFSRSAIIGWILVTAYLSIMRIVPRYTIIAAAAALGVILLAPWVMDYLMGRADLSGSVDDLIFRLFSLRTGNFSDYAAAERAMVLRAGVDLFLDNPIFGAGAGATSFWAMGISTHNQFVLLAAEYGVPGIVAWVWLFVMIWRGSYYSDRKMQAGAALLFAYFSCFSHNLFDFPYWLLSFVLFSTRQRYSA